MRGEAGGRAAHPPQTANQAASRPDNETTKLPMPVRETDEHGECILLSLQLGVRSSLSLYQGAFHISNRARPDSQRPLVANEGQGPPEGGHVGWIAGSVR